MFLVNPPPSREIFISLLRVGITSRDSVSSTCFHKPTIWKWWRCLDHFIKRIFDNPNRSSFLQFWNEFPNDLLGNDGLHRKPICLKQIRNGGCSDAGKNLHHTLEGIG